MKKSISKASKVIRAGHTLIELLLVLAILAMALAMAAPTYDSMVKARRLQKSAEQVEVELQEARVKAMRTGQSQVFRFEVGSGRYTSEPWLSGNEDMNAGPGATVMNVSGQVVETSADPYSAGSISDAKNGAKELESGILFSSANTAEDSRTSYAALQESGGVPTTSSPPIMFYPDGTATTAEIQMEDDEGRKRILQIRGLTGRTKLIAPELEKKP